MAALVLAAALAAACTNAMEIGLPDEASTLFVETFQGENLGKFIVSTSDEYRDSVVAVEVPADKTGVEGDFGLVLKHAARRYAVTAPFSSPLKLEDGKPLVLQYEVQLQEGLSCGGAYMKLYDAADGAFSPEHVTPSSPYIIMFGPDRCGETDKVHFILRVRNPVTGKSEEHHLGVPPTTRFDKHSHLYTLIIRPDDTFEIKVDDKVEREGSMAEDFMPAIQPNATMNDPTDSKPSTWVDAAQVPDPSAVKPEEWDESAPMLIPDEAAVKPAGWLDDEAEITRDPTAVKPDVWDDEEDGEWEAPMVPNAKCESAPGCGVWTRPTKPNPAYKGKWSAPMIANPEYKGVWVPRQVPNPSYYEIGRLSALNGASIGGLGVEVWTMQGGITFDNVMVGRDEAAAAAWAGETFFPKKKAQSRAASDAERSAKLAALEDGTFLDKVVHYVEEFRTVFRENIVAGMIIVITAIAALAGIVHMMCGPTSDGLDERDVKEAHKRRPAKVNDAGAEESEEEEEEEEEEEGKAQTSDADAVQKAASAVARAATPARTAQPQSAPTQMEGAGSEPEEAAAEPADEPIPAADTTPTTAKQRAGKGAARRKD